MKNSFFFIAILALFFAACEAEVKDVALTATPSAFTESVSPTGTRDMTSTIKNTTNNSGTINWSFNETSTVTGWTYAVLIDGQLQNGLTGNFELAANASKTITVKVTPNGSTGTGKAEMVFSQENNTRATITYEATAAPIGPSFSMSTNSESGTATASSAKVAYKSKVINLTNSDLSLRWVRTLGTNNPGRWDIDVCDIVQCHIPTVSTYTFNVPANDSFYLKIGFQTQGSTGTASAKVYLFEPSDSASTVQTFEATHTAN